MMKLVNILIIICAGVLGYAATLYLDHQSQPPAKSEIKEVGEPEKQEARFKSQQSYVARTSENKDQGDGSQISKDGDAGHSDRVPGFSFTALFNDQELHIRDFEGKTVIMNFWASWCAPCIKEFPVLIEAAKERPNDVVLIAASSDFNENTMIRFLNRLNRDHEYQTQDNIHIIWDKDSEITRDIFQTFRLPETFIIGPDQVIREKLIGAKWSQKKLEAILDGRPYEEEPTEIKENEADTLMPEAESKGIPLEFSKPSEDSVQSDSSFNEPEEGDEMFETGSDSKEDLSPSVSQ